MFSDDVDGPAIDRYSALLQFDFASSATDGTTSVADPRGAVESLVSCMCDNSGVIGSLAASSEQGSVDPSTLAELCSISSCSNWISALASLGASEWNCPAQRGDCLVGGGRRSLFATNVTSPSPGGS